MPSPQDVMELAGAADGHLLLLQQADIRQAAGRQRRVESTAWPVTAGRAC
jgi:hypothetical protein